MSALMSKGMRVFGVGVETLSMGRKFAPVKPEIHAPV